MRSIQLFSLLLVCLFCLSSCKNKKEEQWISLFNGKDLSGWDIKIAGYALNENYKNTFIVENGALKANYKEYAKFNDEFGHIYYKTPYSHYKLRLEYRFTGNQTPGGPSWDNRNSGVMIHSQSAASMGIDQAFPVSLEVQYLGGLGDGERPTGNLCTPGTTVEYEGKTFLDHIINSKSKTYTCDCWIQSEIIVLGDSIIHHIIEGDTVLTYTKPKIGGGFVSKDYNWTTANVPDSLEWIKKDGMPLKEGYIALQAESHTIEFRKIELLNLESGK